MSLRACYVFLTASLVAGALSCGPRKIAGPDDGDTDPGATDTGIADDSGTPPEPPGEPPPPPGDTSTDGDTVTDGATTTDADDTGTGTGPSRNLQNHDGSCDTSVWCVDQLDEGTGPHAFAECFSTLHLVPPAELYEVDYSIGQSQLGGSAARWELTEWTGSNAPGEVILSGPLEPSKLAAGRHTLALTPPVRIEATAFCFVLRADGAFAMGLDDSNRAPEHSFIQAAECGVVEYTATDRTSSAGNFCLTAKVRKP